MQADRTIISEQHGQQASVSQRAPMNWRNLSIELLIYGAVNSAVFLLPHWIGASRDRSQFLSLDIAAWLSLTFGVPGFAELRRGGHRRVYRLFARCIPTLCAVGLILVIAGSILKISGVASLLDIFLLPSLLLFASIFPLAVYLNYRQRESNSSSPATHAD
jgi:hypothetical protein